MKDIKRDLRPVTNWKWPEENEQEDRAKTFDIVDHGKLINKVLQIAVRKVTLKVFKSHL